MERPGVLAHVVNDDLLRLADFQIAKLGDAPPAALWRGAVARVDWVRDAGHAGKYRKEGGQAVRRPFEKRATAIAAGMGVVHEANSRGASGQGGHGAGSSAAPTAARTRARASSSEAGRVAPAARRWPPPPKRSATWATSMERLRKLTFTPPRGCSMKSRPTSTPATLRVKFT